MPQHADEIPSRYATRRFHDVACAWLPRRRMTAVAQPRGPLVLPGATHATLDEVPEVCDRCGGPWRRVETGFACYLCPRQVVVGAVVRAAMRSGRGRMSRRGE
jgi:hypothetical protein